MNDDVSVDDGCLDREGGQSAEPLPLLRGRERESLNIFVYCTVINDL